MSIFDKQSTCCQPADPGFAPVANRPGLSSLKYRVGRHGSFKAAMLSALSRSNSLNSLTTRANDDASIALIDGWATVLDVLTFYQERIANEGFLTTAVERRSVLELARAIGYELNPGVAASTYLAFEVESVPGAEDGVMLHAGLKVQSIPGQDELPQMFELAEELQASPALNELRPRQRRPHSFDRNSTRVCLQGTATQLQPGDLILVVGRDRKLNPLSERWDVRTVHDVQPDPDSDTTVVMWQESLGHSSPTVHPAEEAEVHAFREKAALFGHNAPDWRLMSENIKEIFDPSGNQRTQWPDFSIQTTAQRRIDLDAVYPTVLTDSWVVLDKPKFRELYRVETAFTDSATDYTLTAKTTSLILDANRHLSFFPLRKTTAYVASELLPLTGAPIELPVFGDRIELQELTPELQLGRTLIIRGREMKHLKVADRTRTFREGSTVRTENLPPLKLLPTAGGAPLTVATGEILALTAPPETQPAGGVLWHLVTAAGVVGSLYAEEGELTPVGSDDESAAEFRPENTDDEVAEVRTVRAIEGDATATVIVLDAPLTRAYERGTMRINANVSAATHGETRAEIVAQLTGVARSETVGSGDGSLGMQQFVLAQTPLTYTQAATATGGKSSLEIRVEGLAWEEVPSLYGQPGDARVFMTRRDAKQRTRVLFGDGNFGARLPSGRDNISATYRVGTGLEGMVRQGQLQLLMSRPLGLKAVTNPQAAAGAEDPENLDAARANAPLTVLTLDRIVSVQDFEDFARAFAGIGKAQATVLWNGEQQIVHLSVGSADGAPIAADASLLSNLRSAIDLARHADQDVRLDSYLEQRFAIELDILVNSQHDSDVVVESVRQVLIDEYRFEARAFGQAVTASEIVALVHRVGGVEAVVLVSLDGADPREHPTLVARRAHWDNTSAAIVPPVLLLIDPLQIALEALNS